MHHSISPASDDFDYLRRPVELPLTWATDGALAEAICLQTATQFGDRASAPRLSQLDASVEGPRVGFAARFAAALHDGNAAELSAVSEDFQAMGDLVAAVDASAQSGHGIPPSGSARIGLGMRHPSRPAQRLDNPNGTYFRWEVKQAEAMNARWAEARLNGLDCDDSEVIEWIRLSVGERPNLVRGLDTA